MTRQQTAVLGEILGTLPDGERTVLDLYYREERELKEIAGRMRWPYIRARRTRDAALQRLRRRLSSHPTWHPQRHVAPRSVEPPGARSMEGPPASSQRDI